MNYTVKQLASLANISVRTLHYYDEIGLLKPSSIRANGYRSYGEKELLRLQQILFFRELDFPLDEIQRIMNAPNFDRDAALREQQRLLELKKDRLEKLIRTIERTRMPAKGGETMTTDDLFASFNDDELTANMQEAKQRWGTTEAYRQSMERVKHWTRADYERIKAEGEAFTKQLAEAMGKDVHSAEVRDLIAKHYQGIRYFYDCPFEMYRGLADMYVADPRFRKYYDRFRPGLAEWLRGAIHAYCDSQTRA